MLGCLSLQQCAAAHLKELWQQLASQLLDDYDHLGPVTPHQQVLLRAGVREAERARACSSSSSSSASTGSSAGAAAHMRMNVCMHTGVLGNVCLLCSASLRDERGA
jgi:hypothetical protein